MSDLISREAAISYAFKARDEAKAFGLRGMATGASVVAAYLRALPPAKPAPLVWRESHIKPWNGDWHTTSTGYTIRCSDEWGWKWSNSVGGHGYASSPNSAKAEAQADYETRILSALEVGEA